MAEKVLFYKKESIVNIEMNDDGNNPESFLSDLEYNSHVVLLYENPEAARKIEFDFLLKGLMQDQTCIYTTKDVGFIKSAMNDFGIDVEKYLKNKLLQIIPIQEPYSKDASSAKDQFMSLTTLKRPIRVVASHVFQIEKPDGVTNELELEKFINDNFKKLPGCMICTIPVDKIEEKQRKSWMFGLLNTHHAVIFVPNSGEGIALRFNR